MWFIRKTSIRKRSKKHLIYYKKNPAIDARKIIAIFYEERESQINHISIKVTGRKYRIEWRFNKQTECDAVYQYLLKIFCCEITQHDIKEFLPINTIDEV